MMLGSDRFPNDANTRYYWNLNNCFLQLANLLNSNELTHKISLRSLHGIYDTYNLIWQILQSGLYFNC